MIDLEVYYTKWNKSDRDRQIQNDFIYTHISVYEYSIYLCTESTKQVRNHNQIEAES